MKQEILFAFEEFLDTHKEFTKEHENETASPHKPKYPGINTSASDEFTAYCALSDLTETELYFVYALITDKALQTIIN